MSDRSTPSVLIKKNVCRILEPKLAQHGFNVLNRGRVIYFPSTGRQKDFYRQFGEILENPRDFDNFTSDLPCGCDGP
jgi:hypothetical protein